MGGIGGLAGGDTICTNGANAAGLSGTYKAWLSDRTQSPDTRFNKSTVPYVRTDGVAVALSYADLISLLPGNLHLRATINVNEFGTPINPPLTAWTWTSAGGTLGSGSRHCSNWTSTSGTGDTGDTFEVDLNWTSSFGLNCSQTHRVYCFEQ
jgi:hypothetical protein